MNTVEAYVAEPTVWVGCLHHYNCGVLVGRWVSALDLENLTITEIHTEEEQLPGCDELWIFDHENLPVRGELDPTAAYVWARTIDSITPEFRAAYVSLCDDQNATEPIEASVFDQAYLGSYRELRDYIDQTGVLDEIPEQLRSYFDYETYERDLRLELNVIETVGMVHVFSL